MARRGDWYTWLFEVLTQPYVVVPKNFTGFSMFFHTTPVGGREVLVSSLANKSPNDMLSTEFSWAPTQG